MLDATLHPPIGLWRRRLVVAIAAILTAGAFEPAAHAEVGDTTTQSRASDLDKRANRPLTKISAPPHLSRFTFTGTFRFQFPVVQLSPATKADSAIHVAPALQLSGTRQSEKQPLSPPQGDSAAHLNSNDPKAHHHVVAAQHKSPQVPAKPRKPGIRPIEIAAWARTPAAIHIIPKSARASPATAARASPRQPDKPATNAEIASVVAAPLKSNEQADRAISTNKAPAAEPIDFSRRSALGVGADIGVGVAAADEQNKIETKMNVQARPRDVPKPEVPLPVNNNPPTDLASPEASRLTTASLRLSAAEPVEAPELQRPNLRLPPLPDVYHRPGNSPENTRQANLPRQQEQTAAVTKRAATASKPATGGRVFNRRPAAQTQRKEAPSSIFGGPKWARGAFSTDR